MSDPLYFEVKLPLPYEQALTAVEDAFKVESFGIMTYIDVSATLKERLDVDFRPFSVIGVCNPALSHRLLTVEPQMALVLPCKVTVEAADEGHSIVRIIHPNSIINSGLGDHPEIERVAAEAEEVIKRVVKVLEGM